MRETWRFFFFFSFLSLDIFFTYISNVTQFPVSPLENPIPFPSPCLYESAPLPMHPLLPSCPGIPLYWSIKPPQDQEPLLPLISNKAILCYICSQSHGSLHLYSFLGSPTSLMKSDFSESPSRTCAFITPLCTVVVRSSFTDSLMDLMLWVHVKILF